MNDCRECGSARIIKDALAVDRGDYNSDHGFQVAIHENPDAMIFKGAKYSSTRSDVCADCGFISLYVSEPEMLWEAYQNRQNNRS